VNVIHNEILSACFGYLYITDLTNARKKKHIKTLYMWFNEDWADVYSSFNKH